MRIALVTSAALPALDPDDRPLIPAFAALGARAEPVRWDDPAAVWTDFAAVLLRSPWDYFHRLDEFLAWCERTAAAVPLFNPPALARWNLDKRYLLALARQGAPVVPTALREAGTRTDLAALAAERGWREVILKPAVSADSWETLHVTPERYAEGQAHLDRLLASRAMLVQPFLPAVESHGERCLVFLDGEYAHTIRKNPLTRGGRWAGLPEGIPVTPEPAERRAAEAILDLAVPERPLYARVDLVHGADGAPLLLELELIEPTLFLAPHPGAADRLAAALLRRAGLAG